MINDHNSFDAFDSLGDSSERTLTAKEQKGLIKKLQEDRITNHEKDALMGSLVNLVIRVSRSFAPRFPDRNLEDLINDGLLNLWLRLPKYTPERASPSTYTHIVVRTGFCKELQKLKRRSVRRKITLGHGEDAEEKEINVPHMSLNNFINSDGQEYEPDALGVEDEMRKQAEDVMELQEILLKMYKSCCHSVEEYKVLNHILNVKLLPNFGGKRRRKSLGRIAEIIGIKMCRVEKVADRIKPWLKKHDFLDVLSTHTFKPPMADKVFSKDVLDKYFCEHPDEDVWTLLNGNL